MVKIYFPLLFFVAFVLFLSACTPIYCSTPYILVEGSCCIDANADGVCDTGNFVREDTIPLPPQQPQENQPVPSTPVLKTREGVLLKISQDTDPFLGSENASVLFTEFGDYTDANTRRFHDEVLPQLLQLYGTYIRYTFRNYPDMTHKRSVQAAEASECAAEQNKFWGYHVLLLHDTSALSTSSLYDYARDAGLDQAQFDTCFRNQKYSQEVLHDLEDGDAYGIYTTPTFFINNQRISGFRSLATIQSVLEDELHEELKLVQGTTISASSPFKRNYLILEGPAALDPSVSTSPYTNVLDFVDSSFTFTATDQTPGDSAQSQDTAALTARFSLRKGFTTDEYTITLRQLITEGVKHTYFGGVGTQKLMNGNTNIGTSYLPASVVYVTLWGLADVYKNNQLIANSTLAHFMITPALRDASLKKLFSTSSVDGLPEAYLLLSGKFTGSSIPNTEQGFIYLYWDVIDLRQ